MSKSRGECITLTVNRLELICGITREGLIKPVMVQECGHIFEHDAILRWLEKNPTCPCCRTFINNSPLNVPNQLKSILDDVGAQFPEIADMDENEISLSVKLCDFQSTNKQKIMFEPVILFPCGNLMEFGAVQQLIKNNANCPCCNIPAQSFSREVPHVYLNILAALLEQYPHYQRNRDFYLDYIDSFRHENIWEKVVTYLKLSRNHLNDVCPIAKETALNRLCLDDKGLELLATDSVLQNKITRRGLNTPPQHQQITPIYHLVNDLACINMLRQSPMLCEKISLESLNAILLALHRPMLNGVWRGESALYWLTKSVEGILLLRENENLRNKITEEGLNAITLTGGSAVSNLMARTVGRNLFIQDARLRALITEETLHQKVHDCHLRTSAAQLLLNSKQATQLITMDAELKDKIYHRLPLTRYQHRLFSEHSGARKALRSGRPHSRRSPY